MKVKSYGFDGSLAVRPTPKLTLIALASYIHAELKENVELNSITFPTVTPQAGLILCGGVAPTLANPTVTTCASTAGKMVTKTPKWQFGGRAEYNIGPFSLGLQAKHVGSRFATDVNDVKVKGYTIVDLDRVLAQRSAQPQAHLCADQPAERLQQILLRQFDDADSGERQPQVRGRHSEDAVGNAGRRLLGTR